MNHPEQLLSGIPQYGPGSIQTQIFRTTAAGSKIRSKITKRTKGIVVVHYGGYPANMDEIKKIAKKHKLFILEDCAHAQGTQWKGKGVGAIGDMGTFSFQQSKALTCGEGGIILTNK